MSDDAGLGVSTAEGALTRALLDEITTEFPAFRLVLKEGDALSNLIHWLLVVVTFGGQRSYRSHYHTVLGSSLYLAPSWRRMSDVDRVILLRHERVHLRQRARYGWPLFAFLYLVPFFPLGLAYGRARIEWEAYVETMRATVEFRGLSAVTDGNLRNELVRRFVGPDYGFMWPFPAVVHRWYDLALREIGNDFSPAPPGGC